MTSQSDSAADIPIDFNMNSALVERFLRRYANICQRLRDPRLNPFDAAMLEKARNTVLTKRKQRLSSSEFWKCHRKATNEAMWIQETSIVINTLNRLRPKSLKKKSAPYKPWEPPRPAEEDYSIDSAISPVKIRRTPSDFQSEDERKLWIRFRRRWIRDHRRRVIDTRTLRDYPYPAALGTTPDRTRDGPMHQTIVQIRTVPLSSKRGPLQLARQSRSLKLRQDHKRKDRLWEALGGTQASSGDQSAVAESKTDSHCVLAGPRVALNGKESNVRWIVDAESQSSPPRPPSAPGYLPIQQECAREHESQLFNDDHISRAVYGYMKQATGRQERQ